MKTSKIFIPKKSAKPSPKMKRREERRLFKKHNDEWHWRRRHLSKLPKTSLPVRITHSISL